MQNSTKLILAIALVCFAIMAINPNNACAGPFEDFVVMRLNQIGGALKLKVVPAVTEADVPRTGQTTSYATGDDGDLQKGKPWPSPRFTDNGNGTVTDNLTGLIWLKNADCFGEKLWADALSDCNGLADPQCGLSDGSVAGDWRLPNRFELQSLWDLSQYDPALPPGHPFTGVQSSSFYWSATTVANDTDGKWLVHMRYSGVAYDYEIDDYYVWPVRDPE